MKKLPVTRLCLPMAALLAGFGVLAWLPGLCQNTSLVIKPGTTLLVANKTLVLNNADIVNSGTLDASNGNIYFTGSANTSFSSKALPVIKVFTLNKAGKGTVTLNNDIMVTGSLNFQHGLVDLNKQTLSLGGTGVLTNEAEDARITGVEGGAVTAYNNEIRSVSGLNIGNLGAVITSPVGQSSIQVSRMHQPATSPDGAVTGIQRTYLVQPRDNDGLDATLRFNYFDAELNGKNENTLALWRSTDGVAWDKTSITTRNTDENYVEKTGLQSLAYFTLTDADNPLPVKLVYFRATCQNKYALLEWATTAEINAGSFQVEKSANGATWATIQTLPATNSATGSIYSFKDYSPGAKAYYRLKMVAKTGEASYSAVFSGGCQDVAMPFMVSPNPATVTAVASISVRQATPSTIEILTISGQRLFTAAWPLQPGNNQYSLPVNTLAAGVYIVRVLVNSDALQTRLIKQ